jgi:hypothetical protein
VTTQLAHEQNARTEVALQSAEMQCDLLRKDNAELQKQCQTILVCEYD